jgi:flagellar basal-body rod protein FlgB
MKASATSDILKNSLVFRAQRQKIIASNIANINTPNYKEKDLVFADMLKANSSSNDLKLKTTSSNHINTYKQNQPTEKFKVVTTGTEYEQNDKNSVSLDKQMANMTQNSMMVNALSSSIKKDVKWMKLIIDSSGKN